MHTVSVLLYATQLSFTATVPFRRLRQSCVITVTATDVKGFWREQEMATDLSHGHHYLRAS
jgi:hypothetical protein